nr:hypothetical protein [Tanacetum cinerariifolium]
YQSPPPAQVYSPPKKDLSWTGLYEFADDTVTDYSRPSLAIESTSNDVQNRNYSETEASPSTISSKPFIKFVKAIDRPTENKTDKAETVKKPAVKYAELYRKPSKNSTVRGNQRNWNNLKSQQLGLFKEHQQCDLNLELQEFPLLPKNFPLLIENFPLLTENFPLGNFQNHINDKGYWDSGCSRYMTGNISYLSDYEPFDGGYVSFGQGGCKITGKGTIKTGKLEFENVYFVNDLKDFKLIDDTNVLLRTPRQHNMYSIDLNNIVPHKDLTCLVAKASADECMLWHRRLGHLNIKTMNRLVRHNLVRGLPSKCFENDHTCVAYLKGKQHKAS